MPSRGATDGILIQAPSNPTSDNPTRPATAAPRGMTEAMTLRKVTNRMIRAAIMPIISAGPVVRSFSTVGSSPPNSTWTPAVVAGVAVLVSASTAG